MCSFCSIFPKESKDALQDSNIQGNVPAYDAVSGFIVVSFVQRVLFSSWLRVYFLTLYENSTENLIAQNEVQKSFVILNCNMDCILCFLLNKSFLNIFLRTDST